MRGVAYFQLCEIQICTKRFMEDSSDLVYVPFVNGLGLYGLLVHAKLAGHLHRTTAHAFLQTQHVLVVCVAGKL